MSLAQFGDRGVVFNFSFFIGAASRRQATAITGWSQAAFIASLDQNGRIPVTRALRIVMIENRIHGNIIANKAMVAYWVAH